MNINVVNKYSHTPTKNDFYIGRGSLIGNPYTHLSSKYPNVKKVASREEAINEFRIYLSAKIKAGNPKILSALNTLVSELEKKGEVNLVCFCSPRACHGDVIKELIETKLKEVGRWKE